MVVGVDRDTILSIGLIKVEERESAHDLVFVGAHGFAVVVRCLIEEDAGNGVHPFAYALVVKWVAGSAVKAEEWLSAVVVLCVVDDVRAVAVSQSEVFALPLWLWRVLVGSS